MNVGRDGPAADILGAVSNDYGYARIDDGSLRITELGTSIRSKERIRTDDLQACIDARTYSRRGN
ncbi:hypothetical protein [Agromyces sp. NPDC058104]|uniref:hypothetical protein n=1 Tax=Agromyces sp. NPDC058104 TaxID=3346342 RepID=UPI0036DC8CA4